MTLEPRHATLGEAVRAAAEAGVPVTFIGDDGREERLNYAELERRSLAAAEMLIANGLRAGARVPLILPTAPTFLATFYALVHAGALPCPLSMPAGFGSIDSFVHRVMTTARYLGATHLVTTRELSEPIAAALPEVTVIIADDFPLAGGTFTPRKARPDEVAFIQCTSGSTGSPKGVMLTHRNLLSNLEQCRRALETGPDDVAVSWLPLNHDMGLIGTVLFPVYAGFATVLMSTARFQRRPLTWLEAISRHRGTISPAPNFAYGYVTARAKNAEFPGLDLSSLRLALCGAEPIDYRILRAFAERFEGCGLPKHALSPCYGLAEASLAVSFHGSRRPLACDFLRRDPLALDRVVAAGEADPDKVAVVSCGAPVEGTRVRILDGAGLPVDDGKVGRVWVAGPSVMKGYYQLPEATAEVLRDGWLDTGDLGYLRQGELFITGRSKDLIIIRGKNYRPSEFEWAAEQAAVVRPGTAVAFGVLSEEQGTELLYVVCESSLPKDRHDEARNAVIAAVTQYAGLRPDVVCITERRRAVPKTTSGKLQRAKTKALVLSGRATNTWHLP